jgi:hypothetical protein
LKLNFILNLFLDYANQLPIEGGAFYHADLVESSKPIYKEHFTKILLAYSIWLNEIKFEIKELPANQKLFQSSASSTTKEATDLASSNDTDAIKRLMDQKEKLFFMLLGLGLETLSNKTGLAQLTDETIENILESIDYLLRTSLARNLLLTKSSGVGLCVEILSILYKVKLTRDLMSINLMVIKIVEQINDIRLTPNLNDNTTNVSSDQIETTTNTTPNDTKAKSGEKRAEKNTSALIFVILEICMRDLIKYLPNLFSSASINRNKTENANENVEIKTHSDPSLSSHNVNNGDINKNKASFLYIHVNTCKELSEKDVELIINVITVLNSVPFYPDVRLESKLIWLNLIFKSHFQGKLHDLESGGSADHLEFSIIVFSLKMLFFHILTILKKSQKFMFFHYFSTKNTLKLFKINRNV